MADNTELFEYLFAVRISLQDDFDNESDIIKELKLTLEELGISSNQLNQTLHDFYHYYGIDISIDKINEASTVSNQLLNNILGFMLGPGDFTYSGHPDDINNDNNNNDNSDDNDDNDDDIIEEANNIDNTENNQNNLEQQNEPNNFNQLNLNQTNITFTINGNTHTFNIGNQPINILGNSVNTHNSMINVFNSIVGMSNGNMQIPFATSMFSDVIVSTDDNDIEALKVTKLDTKLETDCSICMGHLDKNDEVSELKCSHIFHTDCIKPYLQQYNYKCPVCRSEVGKAKYHV